MGASSFKSIEVSERAKQALDAVAPDDLVRLDQVQEIASGLAPRVHTHALEDVTDFDAQLPTKMKHVLVDTRSLAWTLNTDLGVISGTVRLKADGGIEETIDGLKLHYSSGTDGPARGDHTHPQLHDPVSKQDTDTIALTLAGQLISASVRLATNSALKVVAGQGLAVDLGTSATQAAAGDHTHSGIHNPVTVTDTGTVDLTIDASQNLRADIVEVADPGAGYAPVLKGPLSGLRVPLGTGAKEAAAGDHVHAVATSSADGFMSAADKLYFDTNKHPPVSGIDTATCNVEIGADQRLTVEVRTVDDAGADRVPVKRGTNHLYIETGLGAKQAAAGNHTHDLVNATAAGFMSPADKVLLNQLVSGLETVASFIRHDSGVQVGEYVGGRVTFPYNLRVTEVNVTARAPLFPQRFTLEVGGSPTTQHVWVSGIWPLEVTVTQELDYDVSLDGGRTPGLRWICTSGLQNNPSDTEVCRRLSLNMGVRQR